MRLNCYKTYNKVKKYFIKPIKVWKVCLYKNIFDDKKLFAIIDRDIDYTIHTVYFIYKNPPVFGIVLFGIFFGFFLRYPNYKNDYIAEDDYFESIMNLAFMDKMCIEDAVKLYLIKKNGKTTPQLRKEFLNKNWHKWYGLFVKYELKI